jgi:serine/threonine protein kinase
MSPTGGTVLYKYELKYRVGKGHFGQVWLAHDQTLSRDVAVKILDERMAPAAASLREAQVGNRLNHQNVVKVHYADVLSNAGSTLVLIAMDFYPSGSIMSLVNPGNFVVMPRAIAATIDVLRGLEYLHEQHLFHNDIKPSNILIGTRNEALLTDYGISCLSPGLAPAAAPNAYVLHRAPETTRTNSISVTTDIYQVGLTLFRLVNGIGLIRDQKNNLGDAEFERLKTLGKVPAQRDYMPFVSSQIRRIISRATHPDPSQRYQSALEMRRALERIKQYGYWDAEPNGELFGMVGQNKFMYVIEKSKHGLSMTSNRKNMQSGKTTRVLKYCFSGLSQKYIDQLKKSFFRAVVNGEI